MFPYSNLKMKEGAMARITVEDCLEKIPNRFELTLLAAKRARHLLVSGEEPLVPWENDKSTVVALREIAASLVTPETIAEQEKQKTAEDAFLSPDEMLAQVAASMAEMAEEEDEDLELEVSVEGVAASTEESDDTDTAVPSDSEGETPNEAEDDKF